MEHYQKGGILGIKQIKDPLDHENDKIPQVNLTAREKQLLRKIDAAKASLYDVHMNKDPDTA